MKRAIISCREKAFLVVNYFFLTLVMCISLFPLVHVFALSLSSNSAAQAGWVTILPVDFTLDSYQYILAKPEFFQSFGVSVVRVVLGTLLGVGLTILCAFMPWLSRMKDSMRENIMSGCSW